MLDNLSLAELNAMTKAQLIAALTEGRTETVCTKPKDGKNGQIEREYVTRDLEGKLLKTERWDWTYNADGAVFEIIHTVLDAKAVVTAKEKVTHGKGGAALTKMEKMEKMEK